MSAESTGKRKGTHSVGWVCVGVSCHVTWREIKFQIDKIVSILQYSYGGLVVRVPSYRSRGPGSFPGTTRFSDK
jgi:hypothetical protein